MARYALYYMPDPAEPLWRFGSSVIGYDAATGADVAFPRHAAFDREEIEAWTAEPRRYGFHATLKAPFHLADGAAEDGLMQAAAEFAARRRSFRIAPLQLAEIGAFLALVLAAPEPALQALADDCVRAFDRFRAAPGAADRERRLTAPLTPRQIGHFEAWGYPYVFEDFRFHMTLSGPLRETDRRRLAAAIEDLYAPLRAEPAGLGIGAVAVFRQESRDARFRLLRRFGFPG